ncbi:MAG: YqeG family HAD IIIA-type phosphatase [Lachnospiraceae bacterium]|nr:YqeG family HAD IIIA-type phosphatase [Lachnospiraceae bacterium]
MKSLLYPDDYISSIYDVDLKKLYESGYRGIIFDVDNTLVPHNAPADEKAKAFFQEMNDLEMKSLLLSNNKEPRVKSFKEASGATAYIYKANKPSVKGYEKAMEVMGTTKETTLFVGDQIFTDIWGANRAGIRTIMVEPVLKWKEEIQIILKRLIEAVILLGYKFYVKRGGEVKKVPLKSK